MSKVEKGLIANIHEEKEAVSVYRSLAKIARQHKLPAVAKLFTHIAREEAHHKTELKAALKKVKGR